MQDRIETHDLIMKITRALMSMSKIQENTCGEATLLMKLQVYDECVKFHASRAFLPYASYVPYMPSFFCMSYVPPVLCISIILCTFNFYMSYVRAFY